ncbi:MAG: prepilin-type N-terminal cleavage/methylation domain-containing protein [Candidatus Omnitrophica bacterium]|nr:prepilin-type N-terminal cleavage/methylation domain-containing protein [Candidatus Omnitrophota bacterium]
MKQNQRGFTFVELLVAIAIVIPVLMGMIGVNLYTFRVGETSRSVMTAMQDGHSVIESIRNVANNQGLNAVAANFPSGQAVAGFANLTNEQIIVTYPNAAQDPLQITVTVTWLDRQRAMSRSLVTQVTRR